MLEGKIIKKACEIGFDKIGFTDVSPIKHRDAYLNWIELNMNADMKYMERTKEKRLNPGSAFPWAKSVIMLAVNYYSGKLPAPSTNELKISRYAMGKDYHTVISNMLEELSVYLLEETGARRTVFYTDTGSIMEKELAERAGIGWIGKNTLLITEEYGSWIFLGEILTDLIFECNEPVKNQCGKCNKCITSCPSKALFSEYKLNAEKCISYQTTQNRGKLPDWFPPENSKYIFGCDICQNVCPFNREVKKNNIKDLRPKPKLINPPVEWLTGLDNKTFSTEFGDTPVEWMGFENLKRNFKAVINNL